MNSKASSLIFRKINLFFLDLFTHCTCVFRWSSCGRRPIFGLVHQFSSLITCPRVKTPLRWFTCGKLTCLQVLLPCFHLYISYLQQLCPFDLCNLILKSSKGESGDKKGVDLVPTIREQRNFSGLKSTPVTRAVCPTMCIMNMNGKKSPSTRCNYSASKANRIVSFLL